MEIKHSKEEQKFFTIIDNKESYVRYIMQNKHVINFIKTYVPDELRHQGIAGKLVKEALEYAKENNLKVITTCSYVDYFIDMNKDFEKHLP